MERYLISGLIATALLFGASPARAYDLQNARPLALGGGSRANCPSNSSLYLNPAGMSVGRMYHVETLYGYVPTEGGHIAGASIVDSVTSPIAMGMAFNYVAWDPDGIDRNEYDVRVSAAYYISNLVALGVALKYIYANQEGTGMLPGNLFTNNGEKLLNTVTIDVGATLTIGQHFSLAVVGYNLTHTESVHAPMSLGTGVALTIGSLVVIADALLDFTTRPELMVRAMGGAEYLVADHFPIRVGYRWDQALATHSVSAGLGYISERFGIELSLRQDVSAEYDSRHTHLALSLRYYSN